MPNVNPRLRRQDAQRPGAEIARRQGLDQHDAGHGMRPVGPVAMRQGQDQAFGRDGIGRIAGCEAGQDIGAAAVDRPTMQQQFGQQVAHMPDIGGIGEAAVLRGIHALRQFTEPARDLRARKPQATEIEIDPGGFGDDQMRQQDAWNGGGIELADIGQPVRLRQAAPEVMRSAEDGIVEGHGFRRVG